MSDRLAMDEANWTPDDDAVYRSEVERRFRERTPPRFPEEVEIGNRVVRSEMRQWAIENIGKRPPEVNEQWVQALSVWYQRMAKRVLREVEDQP